MTRYSYRTPGANLWWSDVGEWTSCAMRIDRRRCSAARNAALAAHAAALPRALIDIETDPAAIEAALRLLEYGPPGLARPPRGSRGDHPTTPIIMALRNRAAILRRAAEPMRHGDNWRAVFRETERIPR